MLNTLPLPNAHKTIPIPGHREAVYLPDLAHMRLVHDAMGDQDLGSEPSNLGDGEAGPERDLVEPGRVARGGIGGGRGGGCKQVVESRDWLEGVAGRVGLWTGGGVQDWVEGREVVEVF